MAVSVVKDIGFTDETLASPGVRHALLVYTTPGKLFRRIEDTGTYGWTLATLIGLIMLTGYAEVKTGLIDRSVDQHTEEALAELEEAQAHMAITSTVYCRSGGILVSVSSTLVSWAATGVSSTVLSKRVQNLLMN